MHERTQSEADIHSPTGEEQTPPSDLMNKINNLLFNVLEADSLHTQLPIFTPVTQLGCKLVFIYLFF